MQRSNLARVKDVIETELGIDPAEISERSLLQDDLGAGPVHLAEIVAALEDEFDFEISNDDAGRWRTVEDVVAYVSRHTGG